MFVTQGKRQDVTMKHHLLLLLPVAKWWHTGICRPWINLFIVYSSSLPSTLGLRGKKTSKFSCTGYILYPKVKKKFTLEQTTKDQKGSRCIALLFL